MTTRYTGMNPDGTGNLNDMEHLKQSVRDILITPLASRVMRREYGSLVPDLIDEPMNNTTRLQCMSAAVIALTRWEPGAFTVEVGTLDSGVTEEMYLEMERLIADARPVSRHMTGLNIIQEIPGDIFAAAATYDGEVITIYPDD